MQTICCGAQHWKSNTIVTLADRRSGSPFVVELFPSSLKLARCYLAANCQSGSDPLCRSSHALHCYFLIFNSYCVALLVRTRCPTDHTERSQHDFHCQRAKDESHYTHQDGR